MSARQARQQPVAHPRGPAPVTGQVVRPVAPRVRRVPINPHPEGRDFIVGDIHGAFDAVLDGMAQVGFQPNADRLFSVGDLVDRGSGSARARRFLQKHYVSAVMGNHEANLVELFAQGDPQPEVLEWYAHRFQADWLLALTAEERLEIVEMFRRLPIAIELETRRGLVGLVHGDVPDGMTWSEFTAALERGHEPTIECALESRRRVRSNDWSGVEGVGRVYVGHTPQVGGAARYGNVHAIDTGAVFRSLDDEDARFGLTMINAVFRTESLAEKAATVEAIMALADEGEGAFSTNESLRERFGPG